MKVFTDKESFDHKVNFIDENNVCVGYDLSQDCCEHADWFIAQEITPYDFHLDLSQPMELPGYNFDPKFCQHLINGELDEGDMIIFKLIALNKPDLFLHLFNAQNGYYGHGFEVKQDDIIVEHGYL